MNARRRETLGELGCEETLRSVTKRRSEESKKGYKGKEKKMKVEKERKQAGEGGRRAWRG